MKIKFRQKGEIVVRDFSGDVVVAREKVATNKLPLHDETLDLVHLPVVTIGGKKGRRQDAHLAEFEQQAPDFEGVIYLLPYSWANGWSDGHLYIPSWDALLDKSKRISGGKPEVHHTNYRWLSDGRYVADRALMLHGKAIEILGAEVEQEVPIDELVKKLSDWHSTGFCHPVQQQCLEVWRHLYDLEKRRVGLTDKERDMSVLIRSKLAEKFQEVGIRKATEIPADFAITAEEVAPDLMTEAETLGTVEIPGVGRRLTEQVRPSFGWDDVLTVALSIEEFRQVTSWPFVDVFPMIAELGAAFEQLGYEIRDALQAHDTERLGLLRKCFTQRWIDVQKGKDYPKDIEIANPREVDLPAKPESVVWGFDLLTGEPYTSFTGLSKLHGYGERWAYRWFDSEEAAAKADAEARREAESYMTARKLEAELTAEAGAVELPVVMPEPFVPHADPEIAEANWREKVRKFVETLRAHPTHTCLSSDMRQKLEEITNSFYVPDLSKIRDELRVEWSKAEVIRRRSEQGEILANFGGHFRVMGAAGQCQYWVIQPDGAERDPDEVEYRKRYTAEGSKTWRLVGPGELAISWSKGNTAANHEFIVDKLPAGGCTAEQLATIERLEREINERFDGAVGMSGTISPGIGKGWGLGFKPSSKPNTKPTSEPVLTSENAEPISPSKVDLSKLFGGSAKVRR